MSVQAISSFLYAVLISSLFLIDYALGNGFVDELKKMFCLITCFIVNDIREKVNPAARVEILEYPINLPTLFIEIFLVVFLIVFLKKYKQRMRGNKRIDELLQESRERLLQTNEFLEKWRLRRLNWQEPSEYTYLDDEPQEIKPLEFEVPILHMAIIDTRGTARNLLERGDAGDIDLTESSFLSVTSLLDDHEDDDSIPEHDSSEKIYEQKRNVDFKIRYLWDVMEEDGTILYD